MTSKDELSLIIKAADDKRAHDIMALDVEGISLMSDYFVIMDASSNRQVKAIADSIIEASNKNGLNVERVEGKNQAKWILIDLGDVIVHIFQREVREFYNLEKLWSDAKEVDVDQWIKA